MRISKSNKTSVNANNKDVSRRSADFMRNRLMDKGYSKEEVNNMGLPELKQACEDEGIELVMNCKDVKSSSSTDKALQHIKAAIDILGKSGNKDAVTKDSIANLATVMFDIKASTITAASKCKYSKKECIDAIQDQYGKNKKEAEEYYKSADAKTLEALVDGFKDNAKKTFYDD